MALFTGRLAAPPCLGAATNDAFALARGRMVAEQLAVPGRNITNARKVRYRVVEGAPTWSYFQIANSIGVTYTAGVTGSF